MTYPFANAVCAIDRERGAGERTKLCRGGLDEGTSGQLGEAGEARVIPTRSRRGAMAASSARLGSTISIARPDCRSTHEPTVASGVVRRSKTFSRTPKSVSRVATVSDYVVLLGSFLDCGSR